MKVIMFHSVGNTNDKWYRNWLSAELAQFDSFCKYLKKKRYNTILLEEWYFLQDNPSKIKGNEVVLTFDDGYLDNWVFAYPILKKYGLKSTIFINPEFVDSSLDIRPTIEDVWQGKKNINEIQSLGFLNWNEIREMDVEAVMDVQSHSMSHNKYFYSKEIIDIYSKQKNYDWIAWNIFPNQKSDYILNPQYDLIPIGTPVFQNDRALGVKRYFPDSELIKISIELKKNANYSDQEIISLLNKELIKFPGKFETDKEMMERYEYELFESKKILEENLKKQINYLCWPGGGYNEISIDLSIKAGYKASTIGSREKRRIVDNTVRYKRIQRFGLGSFIVVGGNKKLVKSEKYLIHNFLGRTGNKFYRNINRFRKLIMIIENSFK